MRHLAPGLFSSSALDRLRASRDLEKSREAVAMLLDCAIAMDPLSENADEIHRMLRCAIEQLHYDAARYRDLHTPLSYELTIKQAA